MKKDLVLGIDPGIANTGWGLVEVSEILGQRVEQYICHGTLQTENLGDKPDPETWRRIRKQVAALEQVIVEHEPSVMAVETMAPYSFRGNNAISMYMAMYVGCVHGLARQLHKPIKLYHANRIRKLATGKSRGLPKSAMGKAIATRYGLDRPPTSHAADALGACVAYCARDFASADSLEL